MNIRDKLERLDKASVPSTVPEPPVSIPGEWADSLQRELDARILSEARSFIILKENYYPAFSHPVFQRIRDNGFVLNNFHQLTMEPGASGFNLRKTLFIDLETTGLSGGTGTFAFLIGVGHVELDHIVVRQYVLPDFQYEWLLLKQVENCLLSYQQLVSFNGKSFDIPLLRNRFVLNRMETVLDELVHVDILHAARRLWKRRLGACDLQNLEYEILGQERINDIPGEMIPQIYFEFIRKRRAAALRDVLEHNFHDIVNMILLTFELGQIGEAPLETLSHPEDIYSLARHFYQAKNYEDALPLLHFLTQPNREDLLGKESTYLLSMLYKRTGDLKKSSRLMRQLLEKDRNHPEALEELAKFYEHRERNYSAALEIVEQGIQYIILLEQLERKSPLLEIKESLLHRQQRLRKKMVRAGKNGKRKEMEQ